MGDWRMEAVARVADGGRLPGGERVKEGDIVTKITVTKDAEHGEVNFPTPSPVALSLSIAAASCGKALEARRKHTYPQQMKDGSKATNAIDVATLYEYFEQFMVVVTFSFQAIESYCNAMISHHSKGALALKRKGGEQTLDSEGLERYSSIEEKLSQVLPALLTGTTSPKGTKLWHRFHELKQLRDSTIHFKSRDHYIRGREDRDSLYFRWLNMDPKASVRTAIQMIRHFCKDRPERWLAPAEEQLQRRPDAV